MQHQDTSLRFYFIRHGESVQEPQFPRRWGNDSRDPPLSDLGHAQARTLGRRLWREGVAFDRVYSSTLVRAVQTAEIVLQEMTGASTGFEQVAELVELVKGDWDGQLWDEVWSESNQLYMRAKNHLFTPPGGESYRMVQRRTSQWLEDAILYNEEFLDTHQSIAVIFHGTAARCLLQYILGFYPHFIDRITLENTSITELVFKKEGWFLQRINDAAHLTEIERRGES